MSYSVVIPSKNIGNLTACASALRECGETCRVIVVDDGLPLRIVDDGFPLRTWGDIEIHPEIKPFVFARNVNIGIRVAGTDDVVILGDDGLLKTPRGLARLSQDCAEHPEYGLMAASVDWCGTHEQVHGDNLSGIHEAPVQVAFICVYIPRSTIDRVGLLDERFCVNAGGPGKRGYGLEDDDYCWRVRGVAPFGVMAGLKLGVDNDVFVDHATLKSTFRSDPEHPADVFLHEAVFEQKWGRHPRRPI